MIPARFPRRGYVKAATPVEFLPRFTRALGCGVNVWIKRDDLLPGCGGGNKTRKLDFCIAEALEKGCDTLVTCGAVQSNHCRLTLSWAVHEGMDCHLVLEERIPGSWDPGASGNIFLDQLLGAKGITVVPGGSPMQEEMEKVAERLRAAGRRPFVIPGGASNETGALGYAACAQEIERQMFELGVEFDHLFLASGSGGTQAGLAAGFAAGGTDLPVTGFAVSRPGEVQQGRVLGLARRVLEKLGSPAALPAERVVCDGGFLGQGYSLPTPEMAAAVRMLARTEAVLLDPVYTGKAFAGMIAAIRGGRFRRGANVLFLHTGGIPALYANTAAFRGPGA